MREIKRAIRIAIDLGGELNPRLDGRRCSIEIFAKCNNIHPSLREGGGERRGEGVECESVAVGCTRELGLDKPAQKGSCDRQDCGKHPIYRASRRHSETQENANKKEQKEPDTSPFVTKSACAPHTHQHKERRTCPNAGPNGGAGFGPTCRNLVFDNALKHFAHVACLFYTLVL